MIESGKYKGPLWLRMARWLVIAVVCAIFAVALTVMLVPMLLGGTSMTVQSNSMEPEISENDSVAVLPVEGSIEEGDVVTYSRNAGVMIVHRVIATDEDTQVVITQGDNTRAPDPPVTEEEITGVVSYVVPYGGYLTAWQRGLGAAGLSVLFLLFLTAAWVATDASLTHLKQKAEKEKSPQGARSS